MIADSFDPAGRDAADQGLADWLAGFDVPERQGEPAYPTNFGWTPPRPRPRLVPPRPESDAGRPPAPGGRSGPRGRSGPWSARDVGRSVEWGFPLTPRSEPGVGRSSESGFPPASLQPDAADPVEPRLPSPSWPVRDVGWSAGPVLPPVLDAVPGAGMSGEGRPDGEQPDAEQSVELWFPLVPPPRWAPDDLR